MPKQFLIKAGWQDVHRAHRDLTITIYTIFMASPTVTSSLVITRIYPYLLHSQVLNPSNKLFKISLHISLRL